MGGPRQASKLIRQALHDVELLMVETSEEVAGEPGPGSALDQVGLRDGADMVSVFLDHGEPGLALEHLVYMISEPRLPISDETFELIEGAGALMKVDPSLWEPLRPICP